MSRLNGIGFKLGKQEGKEDAGIILDWIHEENQRNMIGMSMLFDNGSVIKRQRVRKHDGVPTSKRTSKSRMNAWIVQPEDTRMWVVHYEIIIKIKFK